MFARMRAQCATPRFLGKRGREAREVVRLYLRHCVWLTVVAANEPRQQNHKRKTKGNDMGSRHTATAAAATAVTATTTS